MLPITNRNKSRCWAFDRPIRFFAMCVLISLIICWFIALSPMYTDECKCDSSSTGVNTVQLSPSRQHKLPTIKKHRLGVLVPYRDRFEELLQFAPHMHEFLSKQGVDHHIYILNQVDDYRFNRASLINVGFLLSRSECDYVAMHDVDLLPMNSELSYHYPSKPGPFHIASPDLHPRYHYSTFVGGILLIKREEFEQVDGMSNKYWGWGLEDDEFYVRLKEAGLHVSRPENISTGTDNTFRHVHDRLKRKRDMAKCFNQREVTRRRDRETGLHNVAYEIDSKRHVTIDDAPITVANIRLKCDFSVTPWCLCGDSLSNASKRSLKKEDGKYEHKKFAVDTNERVIVPNIRKTAPKKTSSGNRTKK